MLAHTKTIHDAMVDNISLLRKARDSIMQRKVGTPFVSDILHGVFNSQQYASLAEEYFNEYISCSNISLYKYDLVVDLIALDYMLSEIQDYDVFHENVMKQIKSKFNLLPLEE